MPSPLLVNHQGLFNGVVWTAVIDAAVLARSQAALAKKVADLETQSSQGDSGFELLQLKSVQRAMALLAQLPEMPAFDHTQPHLPQTCNTRGIQYRPAPDPGITTAASPPRYKAVATLFNARFGASSAGLVREHEHWPTIDRLPLDLFKQVSKAAQVLEQVSITAVTDPRNPDRKFKVNKINVAALIKTGWLAQALTSGKVQVQESNPAQQLGEGLAYALYVSGKSAYAHVPDQPGGYLDARNEYTPSITGARLYESLKAVERTIGARGLEDRATPVAVRVAMEGLPAGYSELGFEKLGAAVSEQRRKSLHKALAEADLETLQARVKELEAKLGVEAGVDSGKPLDAAPAKPSRSRM